MWLSGKFFLILKMDPRKDQLFYQSLSNCVGTQVKGKAVLLHLHKDKSEKNKQYTKNARAQRGGWGNGSLVMLLSFRINLPLITISPKFFIM